MMTRQPYGVHAQGRVQLSGEGLLPLPVYSPAPCGTHGELDVATEGVLIRCRPLRTTDDE
jgi:hypothetical protein